MRDSMPERLALIALGSNLGNSAATVCAAFDRLQALSPAPIRRSALWHSAPVDCPPDSPAFVNAAAAMETVPGETPESLLQKLQMIETEFGRKPKQVMNEARPLDLDLIAFGREVRCEPGLTLPHPRAHLRQFVLAPLAEVAPHLMLPGRNVTISELLAATAEFGLVVKRIASG